MDSQFKLLSNILSQWKAIAARKASYRLVSQRHNLQLLRSAFISWYKIYKRTLHYRKTRDLFYKKLLIFNYRYLIRKYFRAFISFNQILVTNHYIKERANKFRSQKLQLLKAQLFTALKANVAFRANEKQTLLLFKQRIFQLWHQQYKKRLIENRLKVEQHSLNDVEKWVQERINNRPQPKIHQFDEAPSRPQRQSPQKPSPSQEAINSLKAPLPQPPAAQQVPNSNPLLLHASQEDLEKLLQIKITEFELFQKYPSIPVEKLREIKADIKDILQRIQTLKS